MRVSTWRPWFFTLDEQWTNPLSIAVSSSSLFQLRNSNGLNFTMTFDMSSVTSTISESELAYVKDRLAKGVPLFVEVEDIVSADTICGTLVLGAFGAPRDTRVHVRQAPGRGHIDSLVRHIKGNDFVPGLRKGDIVCFDRVYIEGGDAFAANLSSRTHDGMKGNVQFVTGMARASTTTVNKKGAQQYLTLVDGTAAYQVDNTEEVKLAYEKVRSASWAANAGGFVIRTHEGRAFEYHVGKDNPLQGLIEELEARRSFENGGWLELIPARKFPVGREQVMRDVDVKVHTAREWGNIGRQFVTGNSRQRYSGFRHCAVILCDEDEWAFGGKTGKIQRVAAGIQPLDRKPAVDTRGLPSRVIAKQAHGISELFLPETMERMAAERAARRPNGTPPGKVDSPRVQSADLPTPVTQSSSFSSPSPFGAAGFRRG